MYQGLCSFKGSLLTSLFSYDLVWIVPGNHSVPELYNLAKNVMQKWKMSTVVICAYEGAIFANLALFHRFSWQVIYFVGNFCCFHFARFSSGKLI